MEKEVGLEKEVEGLRSQIGSLEQELEQCRAKGTTETEQYRAAVAELEDKLAINQSIIAENGAKIANLESEQEQLRSVHQEKEEVIVELQKSLKGSVDNENLLRLQLDQRSTEAWELKSTLEEKEKELTILRLSNEKLSRDLEQINTELTQSLGALKEKEAESSENQDKFATISDTLQKKEMDLVKSLETVQILTAQIESLNHEVSVTKALGEKDSAKLRAELKACKSQHETECGSIRAELERVSTLVQAAKDEAEAENIILQSRIAESENREQSLLTEFKVLKEENVSLRSGQQTLEERDSDLNRKTAEINRLNQQCGELTEALHDLKGMNEMFLTKARDADKQLNECKRTVSELEKSKGELERSNVELSNKLSSQREREKILEQNLQEYKEKVETSLGEQENDKHLVQVNNLSPEFFILFITISVNLPLSHNNLIKPLK